MTGRFFLDWAIMAVSLYNTLLLLWLGLTILLNAERRTWGTWLAGGGTLLGGAFFVSHSAILGHGLSYVSQGMDFWWRIGWVPVVALPFAWYVIMLWYSGYWNKPEEEPQVRAYRRRRFWFYLTVLLAGSLVTLLMFANPLPSYWQVAQLDLSATPSLGGIPLLILVYPAYVVLCIILSLDALRRPAPSARVMGNIARRRARPWLTAASIVLLLASLLVAWVMLWIVLNARQYASLGSGPRTNMATTIGWFDLAIAALIGCSVTLLGQAIVSYEVFTGKTLPRRGLFRHWRSAAILATGYGLVVGWSLVVQLRSIYSLLLTTVLMMVFYALSSWRSYAERERYIEHLRPFVASQRLYEHLLTLHEPRTLDRAEVERPFYTLCHDVLETSSAYLVAMGSLAPLAGSPLVYPAGMPAPTISLADVTAQLDSPQKMCLPLDPHDHGGATWAVPLWSERGIIGILFLGEKRNRGLYTQEEIEIARASGERLIDTQASAEMARRLMALQRQRLAQSQVIDQRTRRVLHDDVLPSLHAAMLTLSSEQGPTTTLSSDLVTMLADIHRQVADLLREIPTLTAPEVARLGLIGGLRQVVETEVEAAFDEITFQVDPQTEARIQGIPSLTAEVLFYAAREAIRNAARHGRNEEFDRPLHLHIEVSWHPAALAPTDNFKPGSPTAPEVSMEHGEIEIAIKDNGVGMRSTSGPTGGSGQGLAFHSTMMAVVGGTLAVESVSNVYTHVSLILPSTAW